MKSIFLKLLFLLFFTQTLIAKEYVIVSSHDIRELTLSQVRAVFLKKSRFIEDMKVVPLNLPPRSPLRESFEKKVLKMSFSRLKSYWTKQHYLGHRPPISFKSQASIKAFIKKVDGAIGYIELQNCDKELKILYRWSE